jgi:hypothetical protein
MQGSDDGAQCGQSIIIAHDIVGSRKPLLARSLGCNDGLDVCLRQPATRHDAGNLQFGRAINNQRALDTVTVGTRFDEQGNHQDAIAKVGVTGGNPFFGTGKTAQLPVNFGADHGMQDGLEPRARSGVGKDQAPQYGTVEGALTGQDGRTKFCLQGRQGRAARGGQGMRNHVGIDKGGAMARKPLGYR